MDPEQSDDMSALEKVLAIESEIRMIVHYIQDDSEGLRKNRKKKKKIDCV